MDLSCGSGLFTRRFVGSNKFKGVIAADYSESMLQQTQELFNKDQLLNRRSAPHQASHEMHTDRCSAHAAFELSSLTSLALTQRFHWMLASSCIG